MFAHAVLALLLAGAGESIAVDTLAGTAPLETREEFTETMVAGIDRFLMRMIENAPEQRARLWNRDTSSHGAYAASVEKNRKSLARCIGAVDERVAGRLEVVSTPGQPAEIAQGSGYRVYTVRWPVLRGVCGEGLLLEPESKPVANIIALPDCDWTPEMLPGLAEGVPESSQFARRLAESGCRVLVPVLISRADTYSGQPDVRMTNQPHREFIYRAAFEMGHHIIGYEVQKVLAAVDWFQAEDEKLPVGVFGYGEGGLVAFYAAALDTRIDAAGVSGYFGPRDRVWAEPIYRNVWNLLREFGDAEIASLIAPRPLIIEASRHPEVAGPPAPRKGRSGAAPGAITTPNTAAVAKEIERAHALVKGLNPPAQIEFTESLDGAPASDAALGAFLKALNPALGLRASQKAPTAIGHPVDADARMKRQFDELVEHTQLLMRESPRARAEFWKTADRSTPAAWAKTTEPYRDYLWNEVIGSLPKASLPPGPRTRMRFDEPAYRGYDVQLDVFPDVFASGILLIPKGMKKGERRPVVVCQHGLEGFPEKAASPEVNIPAYNQYGCRLAERGFIVYAPQNPYIGGDAFRVLQRKANPLKLSLFSFIIRQHEQTLTWLAGLPFVDPDRIAFYGISYGGKTALRVPAILPRYCLSICSGDFNEWIWKNVSVRHAMSYLFHGEYEMPEFDLGNTFNHAEMTWLIFPRPFMVERGHHDGCAPDEWVAYEYAKTYRLYHLLSLSDRTAIEYFDGPHAIHGAGTFEFLHKHLNWPAPGKEGNERR